MTKVDAHVIRPEEYEELPELTDAFFAQATRHVDGVPARRGRPPSEDLKQSVHLHLSAEVLEHFRAGGPGWQTRLNETLVRAVRRLRKKAAG